MLNICSFRSVAVNIMDKLQFLIIIVAVLLPDLCNVLLSNYRIYLSSISILKIVAVCRGLLSKVKTLILRLVMWTNMFHCAKFHQKSSNSCREGDLTAFKIVTMRHFGFLKFKFLTAVRDPCCLQCFDAQLMPLPLTVSCTSKIQIGFTFLVPAYQRPSVL